MKGIRFHRETSRASQIAAGLGLGLLCGAFLLGGLAGLTLFFDEDPPSLGTTIFVMVCLLLGGGGLLVSWRLVTGHRRSRDGGLFSPNALRFAGICWFVGFGFVAWSHPLHLLESGFFVGAGVALFVLASRRESGLPSRSDAQVD